LKLLKKKNDEVILEKILNALLEQIEN